MKPSHSTERPDHPEMLVREVEGWTHHATDMDGNLDVSTIDLDRPIGPVNRLSALTDFLASPIELSPGVFAVAERRLSPQRPYQAAPLSFLNAYGRSWTVLGGLDRLEWAEFGERDARSGPMEFWFRNVIPATTALVTIELTAASTGPGVTGTFEVRSSAAAPRQFPVSGFRDHTVDLIVHPDNAFAVLVTLEPAATSVGYLAFREITYQTL